MSATVLDVVDEDQLELEPMVGQRVSLLVKSRTGTGQVCLHLSPEAAIGLLADLEQAIDLAESAGEDDGSDAAHDARQDDRIAAGA